MVKMPDLNVALLSAKKRKFREAAVDAACDTIPILHSFINDEKLLPQERISACKALIAAGPGQQVDLTIENSPLLFLFVEITMQMLGQYVPEDAITPWTDKLNETYQNAESVATARTV